MSKKSSKKKKKMHRWEDMDDYEYDDYADDLESWDENDDKQYDRAVKKKRKRKQPVVKIDDDDDGQDALDSPFNVDADEFGERKVENGAKRGFF